MASRAAVIAALRRKVAQRCWTIQANAHAELTVATPVDTGNARANWQATLDAPAVDVVTVGAEAVEPAVGDFFGDQDPSHRTPCLSGRRTQFHDV